MSRPSALAGTPASDVVEPQVHRVTVRLRYRDRVTGMQTTDKSQTPWKWRADCTCGWGCLSWSWLREYEVIQSGLTREQYVAECGEPVGGTMSWVWEHLAEVKAEEQPSGILRSVPVALVSSR